MHARFVQSSVLALAGGFVVVASQAFTSGTTAWLAFAIGVAALVLATAPALARTRDRTLALDAVTGILAVWTIVASLVFSGTLVTWLSFAEGAGFVLLALAGLTLDHVALSHGARRPAERSVAANNAPASNGVSAPKTPIAA